jgi:hypothetical protein
VVVVDAEEQAANIAYIWNFDCCDDKLFQVQTNPEEEESRMLAGLEGMRLDREPLKVAEMG